MERGKKNLLNNHRRETKPKKEREKYLRKSQGGGRRGLVPFRETGSSFIFGTIEVKSREEDRGKRGGCLVLGEERANGTTPKTRTTMCFDKKNKQERRRN